ncbi:olfactory receptor 52D1-like [Aplochiton taeniatus]
MLMLVIYIDTNLHKPMYIFLFNLAGNGLVGCLAVCPKIMDSLLRETQDMSYGGCLLQVFAINLYATCAYVNLSIMAYDRYVSICKPLQYHTIMNPSRVKLLVFLMYCIPAAMLFVQVYLTSLVPLCGYTINKLFCDNLAVVNLLCVRSPLINLYGIFVTASLVALPFFLVMLSYILILIVCWKLSKESQNKALSTCAPHLITFTNYSLAIFFSVVYNRYSSVSKEVNVLVSAQFIFFPPILNPLIYGIRTKEIRKAIAKLLRKRIHVISYT